MLQNLAQATCMKNGQPVDCGEVTGIFAAIFIPLILFGIIGFIFWIISLIHVLKHDDVKDRVIWILVILLVGGLGGIIYYFAVKRPYDKQHKNVANDMPANNQTPPSVTPTTPESDQQPTEAPQDDDQQQTPPSAPPTA